MPKRDGVNKTYSFDRQTVEQMQRLMDFYKLGSQTALLEYLINKEIRETGAQGCKRSR